jgi:hypothetical protein
MNESVKWIAETGKVITAGSVRWLGQLSIMKEEDSCRKITFHKPEGID